MSAWVAIEPIVALITSVSSVVVAVIVGLAVIRNQRDQREHNKLSVRPMVHARIEMVRSEGLVLTNLSNHGLGPAMVTSLQYMLKSGEAYPPRKLMDLCLRLVPDLRGNCKFHIMDFNFPFAIRVGDVVEVLKITIDDPETNYDLVERVRKSIERSVDCDVQYESLYGEKFNKVNP